MAGYSGTPLPRKLGIKPGARLGLVHAPGNFLETLGALPDGVVARDGARGAGPFDVIVCFVSSMAVLTKDLPLVKRKLDPAGGLWIAWPKKAAVKISGLVTDLSEGLVRARGLATGLVDNKVCAIDEVWSGLRFVVRLIDRPHQVGSRSSK